MQRGDKAQGRWGWERTGFRTTQVAGCRAGQLVGGRIKRAKRAVVSV